MSNLAFPHEGKAKLKYCKLSYLLSKNRIYITNRHFSVRSEYLSAFTGVKRSLSISDIFLYGSVTFLFLNFLSYDMVFIFYFP